MTRVSNVSSGSAPKSPTQEIVAEANRVAYATDALGRRLGFKRINASLRRRVLKAMSAESAEKGQLFVMAVMACACVEIDGEMLPFPANEIQVDARIDRLEQEGLEAIATGLAKEFGAQDEGSDLKNS